MQSQTHANAKTQALRKLSNTQLFESAKTSVAKEAHSTLDVLYILKEIQRRRAFAQKQYPSLFEFCVDFLGYKRDAAYRRISAMKALSDLPETEEKVRSGSLSLDTLSQVQSHFTRKLREKEPLNKEEKLKIITKLENKSTRETEKFFLELAPKEMPEEKLKAIDHEFFELKLAWPKRVQEKLEKLKTLMGVEKASIETIEIIETAFDTTIKEYGKKFDKSENKVSILRDQESKQPHTHDLNQASTHISTHTRRQVWRRDGGQCTHVDTLNKQRCPSKFRLEIDHIQPRVLGGENNLENLRLTCRAHNQWAAINKLGLEKMAPYIDQNTGA